MSNARARIRDGRGALAALLLGGLCFSGWGCHQHYYYYTPSGLGGCPPPMAPAAVAPLRSSDVTVGPVCDVPTEIDGATVIGSNSAVVDAGRGKSRVVVSKPERRPSRIGWRSSNPEDVPAFTQIDGAVGTTVK